MQSDIQSRTEERFGGESGPLGVTWQYLSFQTDRPAGENLLHYVELESEARGIPRDYQQNGVTGYVTVESVDSDQADLSIKWRPVEEQTTSLPQYREIRFSIPYEEGVPQPEHIVPSIERLGDPQEYQLSLNREDIDMGDGKTRARADGTMHTLLPGTRFHARGTGQPLRADKEELTNEEVDTYRKVLEAIGIGFEEDTQAIDIPPRQYRTTITPEDLAQGFKAGVEPSIDVPLQPRLHTSTKGKHYDKSTSVSVAPHSLSLEVRNPEPADEVMDELEDFINSKIRPIDVSYWEIEHMMRKENLPFEI
ncbi:MAG: hypothetical protein ABEJ72_07565 [Candidatus Aenigmatarchaeota archaeon]